MPSALTPSQFEILKRLREGLSLFKEPAAENLVGDLRLLERVGLVEIGPLFATSLTELGGRYLRAAEEDSSTSLLMRRLAAIPQGTQRVEMMIAEAAHRCANLERTLATLLASGLDTSAADAALAASYNALRIYRERLEALGSRDPAPDAGPTD